MSEEKRSYRTKLASHGLIYLADKEIEILVRNLSITGLLAELDGNAVISGIEDVFHALENSATIDLYLPEMHLAGEADVVRAEKIGGRIYLALEYRNLTYDVNNLLYKRKAYRKAMTSPGEIMFNKKIHSFVTQNVSVDGLMIYLNEYIDVDIGDITSFNFPQLKLKGEVKVVWVDCDKDDSTLMGLQYVQMKKEYIKGIPSFFQILK